MFGILERDRGLVRAAPVPDGTQFTLEPVILTNVVRGSIVSSDEHRANWDLKNAPYNHGTVDHSIEEYVRGIYHVNGLEGFWSRFKNSVKGTHVHISRKHVWKYVAKFSYRHNWRICHRAIFTRLVAAFSLPRPAET